MCRSRRGICWGLLCCVWMLVLLMSWTAVAKGQDISVLRQDRHTVRVVYLVPSDRVIHSEYKAAIADAIANVQGWYHQELDGKTFLLRTEKRAVIVDTHVTSHPDSWYATNPNGCDFSIQFWCNALADGFALTGGSFDDPLNIWIFYIDADTACGQVTGGTNSNPATFCPSDSLLWLGFRDYPDMYLLPEDKTILNTDDYASNFFARRRPVVKYRDCQPVL